MIGSRPTPGTRCIWPGCCGWTRSPRWRCPSVEQEAARDLVRAREDCRGDLMRARHRLSKLLLRHGIVYSGGQAWTGAHDAWLRRQRFDAAGAADWRSSPTTRRCWRSRPAGTGSTRRSPRWPPTASSPRSCAGWAACAGSRTLTGFALAVEIGDWHRFTGTTIGSFVGLVPSRVLLRAARGSQGSITKTGNTHARRLLVEAAWHHRARYVGRQDHARPLGAGPASRPGPRRCRATGGCTTLGHVHRPPQDAHVIANVAIARELAGWCWSLAVLEE